MKRPIILLLCLSALCAAGVSTAAAASDVITIKVGAYENQPKIFTNAQNEASGFWPDIINYAAAEEGWQIEWVHGTWTECLEKLEKNEIDIMPDVAYTQERAGLYDFSKETVYVSWSGVYVREKSNIQSILDLEGKTVAVLKGSINVEGAGSIKELARDFSINCDFIEADSYLKVFQLVENKEADAGVVNKDFAYNHEAEFKVVPTNILFQPARLYFAFPKGASLNALLVDKIDAQVRQLKANGGSIYFRSLEKWFGVPPMEKPVVPGWFKWLLTGIGGVALVLAGGDFLLRFQVKRKTKELAEAITKHEKTEKALRESEEKLKQIFEAVPEGITLSDTNGVITGTNRAVVRMHGYNNRDEIINKNFIELIAGKDQDEARRYLEEIKEKGVIHNVTCTFVRKDGSEFPAELSAAVINGVSNSPAGIITVTADISERLQAGAEHDKVIEYQELDKLKTNLLSTVSHELRTPLASIKGYASMLLTYEDKVKSAQKRESLEAIDRSADRLTELIDHLLDMSRLDAGLLRLEIQTVEPREIFTAAVAEAKLRAPKYRFKTTFDSALPEIAADGRRLRQVIDNLLENAIKYSPQKTVITVSVEAKPDELLVSIVDQGIGIPADELNKIFERMYRIDQKLEKDPGGLGLGLSFCKALVIAHGGRIWAESQVGKGSTFYFTLPLRNRSKKTE
jgi:PAS domain S-box-containing protein